MGDAAKTGSDTIRAEAQTLRALLEARVPDFRGGRRDVELPAGTPEHLKVFWETLGYAPTLRPYIYPPDVEPGHREVEKILSGWSPSSMSAKVIQLIKTRGRARNLTMQDLPRKFRLVGIADRYDTFFITDETRGEPDPAVYKVSRGAESMVRVHPSYLRRAVEKLLVKAFTSNACDAKFSPPLRGESVMPTLAPHVESLGNDLWRLGPTKDPSDDPDNARRDRVGYASFDGFVRYVHGLEGRTLVENGEPGGGSFLPVRPHLREEVEKSLNVRTFKTTLNGRDQYEMVGFVRGVPCWIQCEGGEGMFNGLTVAIEVAEETLIWIEAGAPVDGAAPSANAGGPHDHDGDGDDHGDGHASAESNRSGS